MKLYTFEVHGQHRLGAEWKGEMIDLETARDAMIRARGSSSGSPGPHRSRTCLSFLRAGEAALAAAREALAFMAKRPALPVGEQALYSFSEIKVLAPLPRPGKILCSGINYRGTRRKPERHDAHRPVLLLQTAERRHRARGGDCAVPGKRSSWITKSSLPSSSAGG